MVKTQQSPTRRNCVTSGSAVIVGCGSTNSGPRPERSAAGIDDGDQTTSETHAVCEAR